MCRIGTFEHGTETGKDGRTVPKRWCFAVGHSGAPSRAYPEGQESLAEEEAKAIDKAFDDQAEKTYPMPEDWEPKLPGGAERVVGGVSAKGIAVWMIPCPEGPPRHALIHDDPDLPFETFSSEDGALDRARSLSHPPVP